MIKLIKRFFLLSFTLFIALIGYKVSITPQMVTPYPYQISTVGLSNDELNDASMAQLLIIGDQMAESLSIYQKPLEKIVSENLRNPLNIYNWSKTGEGIHRSVAKLQALAKKNGKLPRVILYMGGSDEFYEDRFELDQLPAVKRNFTLFQNDSISTFIMLFPWSSRLLYMPTKRKNLAQELMPSSNRYTFVQTQTRMEWTFKFYEYHLNELINLARAHDSTLVLATTPVNLEVPPRRVCPNSEDNEIISKQKKIKTLIQENRFKEAYEESSALMDISTGNAMSAYLKGYTALRNHQRQKARDSFRLAASLDCENWRMNPVFNAILQKQASEYDLHFIDFDRLINQHLGSNVLFLDSKKNPQHLYYQQFIQILGREIREILRI